MNLFEFSKTYPDEKSCRRAWKEYRDETGVFCRKRNSSEHYWKSGKEQYQCKRCGTRTTLRSGTVMQGSNLPYLGWFKTIHLMTSTKKSISAKEVQRQLGRKRYEPVWAMMHKIRAIMGLRDDRYQVGGGVEMDEGFFSTAVYHREGDAKRGHGSENKTCVLVMAESEDFDPDDQLPDRPAKRCGYFKMNVIHRTDAMTFRTKVEENMSAASIVSTDGLHAYPKVKEVVKEHRAKKTPPKQAHKFLPWVHIAISNAKRLLLDTFHRIDEDFLENYLNEFCFKLNRRYHMDLMKRALVASVSMRWNYLG